MMVDLTNVVEPVVDAELCRSPAPWHNAGEKPVACKVWLGHVDDHSSDGWYWANTGVQNVTALYPAST